MYNIIFNAHFLLYIFFFATDLLLAICLIDILDYGNDVRQKANSSDSIRIQVQNRLYRIGENLNINNAFGPGTANESTV